MVSSIEKKLNVQRWLPASLAFIGLVLFLYYSNFGCPIKFLTGISCPGCGMTRAWLAAFHLRFDLALAYHPLFWLLPIAFALAYVRTNAKHMPARMLQLIQMLLVLCIVVFVLVWVVRLALPNDANMLFSGLLNEDVVSIEAPRWLALLHAMHT